MKSDADVALLQEAGQPPPDVAADVEVGPAPWRTAGAKRPWRAAVVRLSDRVKVEWIVTKRIDEAGRGEMGVSRLGTLDAAIVTPRRWEIPSFWSPCMVHGRCRMNQPAADG